jgi:hypothetical protein
MDASELSSVMEEEEMFSASELSSEMEEEEMFSASEFSSEMEEEQTLSEHDDVHGGISVSTDEAEKISVSPKNGEEISSPPEILEEYPTSLPSVENPPEDEISQPQAVIDGNQSPEASTNSEDLQDDILNHDQFTSKNSEGPLFQIMKIVSDKQELSFVDKVFLPEEQILGLCNRILPNAADNQYPDIRIDFKSNQSDIRIKSLNQVSLPIIGFYGDKRTMGRILKEMGVVDDSIHKQMEEEKFEPGLYVGHLEQVIIVFYWHQETHLKDASRKNVSCNFIRYVVDLCDDIYVCVEDHNLLETPAVPVATTSLHTRSRRTQKLKIGHVQNSENDVTVSSGFHVNIGRYISTPTTEGFAIMPKQTLFFAEGYHRCAFLTANYKGSRKFMNPQIKKVPVDALASELQQLSKGYDLDFTRLGSDDFVSLLVNSALPESQSYKELMGSIQVRRAENRKFNIQSKLKELEEQILQNFLHVLPEYCSFIRYLSDSESKERGHVAAQKIHIEKNLFQHLEHQLATIWGGNSGRHKLLFVGSVIKFHPTDGVDSRDSRFIVERSGKSTHPIVFEEEIILRYADKGGKTEKARFSKSGVIEKRPVVSGEQLILKVESERTLKGILEVSEDATRGWGESLTSGISNWRRNSGRQKQLFVGSEIKFHPTDGVDSRDSRFIVESSGKSAQPIMLEEEILLRCTDKGGNTEKARVSKSGVTEKRPVVSGEEVILKVKSERTLKGILEVSEDALREWVKSFVPKKLLTLEQNIVFLGFLLSDGILKQMKSFGQPIINNLQKQQQQRDFIIEKRLLLAFLTSNDKLEQVKNFNISDMEKFLTSGSLDNILAEIEYGKADRSPAVARILFAVEKKV